MLEPMGFGLEMVTQLSLQYSEQLCISSIIQPWWRTNENDCQSNSNNFSYFFGGGGLGFFLLLVFEIGSSGEM